MALWQDFRSSTGTRSSDLSSLAVSRARFSRQATDDNSNWIFTFADVVTLLMAFFLILASVSDLNEKKFAEVKKAIAANINVNETWYEALTRSLRPRHIEMVKETPKIVPPKPTPAPTVDARPKQAMIPLPEKTVRLEKILGALEEVIKNQGLTKKVTVHRYQDAATVSFPEGIFFGIGSAEFSRSARPFLDRMAKALLSIRERFVVEVEGHTDSLPVVNNRRHYATNWELSTARAAQVVRHLIDRGVEPGKLVAKGFADTRPVADNSGAERARNRRVVIRILAADGENGEGASK